MSINSSDETVTATKQNPLRKAYKCTKEDCSKSFKTRHGLKYHLEAHLRDASQTSPKKFDTKYTCDVVDCCQTFTRKWSLTVHKEKKHNKINENKKQYKCTKPDCYAIFTHRDRLETHRVNKHSEERFFKCNYEGCEKRYRNNAHLKRHESTSHSLEKDNSEVVCDIEGCGKTYCNKYVLNQHMAAAHQDDKETVKRNGEKKKSDIEKRHRCDEPGCGAAFNRPYRLSNHKLTVHCCEKPFKCLYQGCDKSYTNESHLARHKITTHFPIEVDTTQEVICGEEGCGRIFSNKYSLKKHIATNHTELPFTCQKCGEKFKRKSRLHAHKVEVHEEEAPYKCSMCSRMFIHFHLYNKHLKNHKTYTCDCKKTFNKWSELVAHRKAECTIQSREYKCIICEKTFATKSILTQHSLNVHIPDSQLDLLQCPYVNCKYSYKYKNNLNYHIRTHHLKLLKINKCPEENCKVLLNSNKNLKQHLRIIHHGLPEKIRKPRRPRKDKGKPKKSMASVISGFEVSAEENYRNIVEKMDVNLKQDVSDHLDEVECGEIGKLSTNEERCDDQMSCGNKNTDNTENKKAEESTTIEALMDYQETTPDVHKLLRIDNYVKNDKILENCRKVTSSVSALSIDKDYGCTRNPITSNDKLKECDNTQRKVNMINSRNEMKNQKNSENKSFTVTKDFKNKNYKEIDGQNNPVDFTLCNINSLNVSMDIDSEPSSELLENTVLQMSAEVQLGKTNNSDNKEREKSFECELVEIDETLQSNVEEGIVGESTSKYCSKIKGELQNFNTDPILFSSSQNNCESEVVIFDFPEFAHIDENKSIQNLSNEETSVERSETKNIKYGENNSYMSDEKKLQNRLGLMLNDIFSILKHIENDGK